MNKFPEIYNIDQFNEILSNKREVKLKIEEVDGVKIAVISYSVQKQNTFNSDLARECRGITFNYETGEVIARPFHKFFNINEREDTQVDKIHWCDVRTINTKFDGSLIMPVLINDKIFWKSKKSFSSEVAIKANSVWNKEYMGTNSEKLVRQAIAEGLTPLFEFIDIENPIVIRYEKTGFTFLCLRHNITGEYVVEPEDQTLKLGFNNTKDFISYVTNIKDKEGYVLFTGSEMYKVKTSWYTLRHRTLSKFSIKNILDIYVNDTIDDFLSELYTYQYIDQAKIIEGFRDDFTDYILSAEDEAEKTLARLKKKYKRTELRIQIAQEKNSGLLFAMLDGKDHMKILKDKMVPYFKGKYKDKTFFMGTIS